MFDGLKRLGVWVVILNLIFVLWLIPEVQGMLGWLYLCAEVLIAVLSFLFVINHWQRQHQLNGGEYSMRTIVDIFITTKNEPASMLRRTIMAANEIEYPNFRVYVLDDGGRRSVKNLAKELGVKYLSRPDKHLKAYKAANLNFGLNHSYGSFVLVLDADQIVNCRILDDILGHFKTETVAFVTTKQAFNVPQGDFNHDHLFYNYMQTGKNANQAAISCGSGVIYRRSALEKIGGFQEWNIVEDLATSYELNRHGYISTYVNQSYTLGTAPQDLKTIYKQRGIWAHDALRLWIWKMPIFDSKLTLRQRLHYFEIGYIYVVSALAIPLLLATNIFSVLTNTPLVSNGLVYVLIKFPSFILAHRMFDTLGQGTASSRMWATLFPVYLVALIKAALFVRPKYRVTDKFQTKSDVSTILFMLPHLFILLLLAYSLYRYPFQFGLNLLLLANVFWLGVFIYWFSPIFVKTYDTIVKSGLSIATERKIKYV